jgi:hypothetical protein
MEVAYSSRLSINFLLGSFLDPEDGGDMFLRNVSCLSTDYTALCPRRHIFITTAVGTSDPIQQHFPACRLSAGIYKKLREGPPRKIVVHLIFRIA